MGSTRITPQPIREVLKMALKGHIPWNKGIPWDEETKRKIGLKSLGRLHSEEWKKLHSRKMKGVLSGKNNPMFGKLKELNPNWRGGIFIRNDGYVAIHINDNEYELEHRLVMEQFLGRKLLSGEIVHHINGIRNDNRLENLMLLDNQSEHVKIHKGFKAIVQSG
jgi:hypothetical protein